VLLAAVPAVAGARTERQLLSIVHVARGFQQPVYLTAPRSEPGRLYVVEQEGRIQVLEKGKRRVFLDIRSRVGSDSSEQGLLSMAFHPGYAKNRRFYVNYTDLRGHTRVVEFRSDGRRAKLGTARRVLFVPQPYANHNGGQLQFGPDGKLYVGMGDGGGGGDPDNNGQNPRALLAKLLRTNPLSVDWEVAGYGLRNPWRFSFDRKTGDLYIGDVGQNAREEIDYRPRGAPPANFGWARYEGSRTFNSDVELDPPSPSVFPIHEYGHGEGCSVAGGYVYRGSAVPAAQGRYFFGDSCSGTVWSLRVQAGQATDVRREPFAVLGDGYGLVSFGEDARGELYLVSHGGDIYRLAR
jgi:glucose/arabinose dehydrogenase